MDTSKLAITLRDGAIAASIWLHKTRAGVFYDVTFARSWKDPKSGKVGYSMNFSDLYLDSIIDLALQAKAWILEKKENATVVRLGDETDPAGAS